MDIQTERVAGLHTCLFGRAQLREPADYQIAHYAVHFQPDPGAGLGSLAFAPVLDVLRNLERKSVLLEPKLGNRRSVFGLCARSGFTSQARQEATQRDDLLLFDLPRIVQG